LANTFKVQQDSLERAKNLYIMGDITQEEYQARRDECQALMPSEPPPTELPHLEQIAKLLGNFEMLWAYAKGSASDSSSPKNIRQ
jgi:hypothetical protein